MIPELNFLLVGNETDSWVTVLNKALSPLGELRVVSEDTAESTLKQERFDVCLIDEGVVYNAAQLISYLHKHSVGIQIIAFTATPTWKRAKDILQAGATDYLRKSGDYKQVRSEVRSSLERHNSIQIKDRDLPGKLTILLADNDLRFIETRAEFLKELGYQVLLATSPSDVKRIIEQEKIDVVVLDIRMNSDDDDKDDSGLILAGELDPSIPKIIMTGFPSLEFVHQAFDTHSAKPSLAYDFIAKKDGIQALIFSIKQIEGRHLTANKTEPSQDADSFENIEAISELLKIKNKMDSLAQQYAKRLLWIYLGGLVIIWIVLLLLTYSFGWTRMEPWTYFIGFGATFGSYIYFAVTQRELSPRAIYDHFVELRKRKNYQTFGVDLEKYENLKEIL